MSPLAVLLRYPDFGLLWIGQTLSLFGSTFSQVALPLLVLAIGGSAIELGTVAALGTGSYAVLLLVGGVIVDRNARRRVVLVIELSRGAVNLVIALLAFTGALAIWHVYIAAVVTGALSAFATPADNALVAEVMPRDQLTQANSWRSLSIGVSRIAGGGLAALVVSAFGPAIAIVVDAASYFINAGFVARVRAGRAPLGGRTGLWQSAREGFVPVWRSDWIRLTIVVFAFTNAVTGSLVAVVIPVVAAQRLGGALALGGFASGLAAGAVIAATIFTQVRFRHHRGAVAYLASAFGSVGLSAVPLTGNALGAIVGGLFLGIGSQVFTVIWNSSLQEIVPRDKIGRVTSLDWFGSLILAPIGNIAIAALATRIDPLVILVVGGLTVGTAKVGALLIPRLRDFEPEVVAAAALTQ
jgi:MFS family permease